MDGWQALFQRSNRPLAIAWQPGGGWQAGRCHAAAADGPLAPSPNHTQPPDIKMLSRTGQDLGLHWAPSGKNHQLVNRLSLAHRPKMHKSKREVPTSPKGVMLA